MNKQILQQVHENNGGSEKYHAYASYAPTPRTRRIDKISLDTLSRCREIGRLRTLSIDCMTKMAGQATYGRRDDKRRSHEALFWRVRPRLDRKSEDRPPTKWPTMEKKSAGPTWTRITALKAS